MLSEIKAAQKWEEQKFLDQLLKEANELLAIFTSAISKLKLEVL